MEPEKTDRTFSTDREVAAIEAPESGWVDWRDTRELGLTLRVFPGGAKSWVTKVRVVAGVHQTDKGPRPVYKSKRFVLGHYLSDPKATGHMSLVAAREERRKRVQLAKEGRDPSNLAKNVTIGVEAERTFARVAEEFLSDPDRPIRGSTRTGYEVAFRSADWGSMPLAHITEGHAKAVIARLRKDDYEIAANRAVSCLKAFFRWAVEKGYVPASPVATLKRNIQAEVERQVALEPGEIRELWHALDAPPLYRKDGSFVIHHTAISDILRLALLTGARKNEIADAKWSEVRDLHGDDPRLELPPSRHKTGSKSRKPRVIRLSSKAAEIINARPRQSGHDYIFRRAADKRVLAWSSAQRQINRRIAEARKAAGNHEPFVAWCPHDLRRTMRTRMTDSAMRHFLDEVRAGDRSVPWHVLELILGHAVGKLERTYSVTDMRDDVRVALEAWALYLEAIVSGTVDAVLAGSVVQLTAARRAR